MTDWIPIRVKTEKSQLDKVVAKIEGWPAEVMQKYYFQRLQSVTASAVDVMKNYIEFNPAVFTPTGQARKAAGGNGPGRKDSGDMIAGIKWEGRKQTDVKYLFKLGWLDGTPGYAIFQEQGTKNGVVAMNSIQYTTEFVRAELRLLATNPSGYKVTNARKWSE